MTGRKLWCALAVAVVTATGVTGVAQEKGGAGKEKNFETKGQQSQSAATVPFGEKLGLPFPSLLTLGTRIEQARRDADPVGLLAAAQELAVAEKVSGKQAGLTADTLAKEAVELAKLRQRSAELKAVSLMATDEAVKKGLGADIKTAQDAEAKAAQDLKDLQAGGKARGIEDELIVYNNSYHTVRVYVNGEYVGHVHANSHGHFHVHTHGHTHLRAEGGGLVWRQHFDYDYDTYRWRISE